MEDLRTAVYQAENEAKYLVVPLQVIVIYAVDKLILLVHEKVGLGSLGSLQGDESGLIFSLLECPRPHMFCSFCFRYRSN